MSRDQMLTQEIPPLARAVVLNRLRNVIGGFLWGFGLAQFFCFILLERQWVAHAPSTPNPARGLTFIHNEHGSYTYFSQTQATAAWLMFFSFPIISGSGFCLIAKKNIRRQMRWYAISMTFDPNDPGHWSAWSTYSAFVLAPVFFYFAGPFIVRQAIVHGVRFNLG